MHFKGHKYLLAGWMVAALLLLATLSGIQWLLQPKYLGRTVADWLRILASEPRRSGSPLDIVRVHVDTDLHTSVEVPLSYDVLREHNFVDGHGKIYLIIDHDNTTVHDVGQTNGNCLFSLPWWGIAPGLHEVTVEFVLWTGVDQCVSARGSPRSIAFDDHPTSH